MVKVQILPELNYQFGCCQLQEFASSLDAILSIICQRMQKVKTVKFVSGLVVAFTTLIAKHGVQVLLERLEAMQAGLFTMVVAKSPFTTHAYNVLCAFRCFNMFGCPR